MIDEEITYVSLQQNLRKTNKYFCFVARHGMMAQNCNLSFLGDGDQEGHGFRSAQAKD
jgi:hypothetical protein